jgi:CBS-domain-containing membrane protein
MNHQFHKDEITYEVTYKIIPDVQEYEEETNCTTTKEDGFVNIIDVVKQNESEYLDVDESDMEWLVQQIELKEGLKVSE